MIRPPWRLGFNEARAFCAGNRGRRRTAPNGPATRFNEARAFCAGNHDKRDRARARAVSFNEARAFCAGNRQTSYSHLRNRDASMRPALSAREIVRRRAVLALALRQASMRPALSAREIWQPSHGHQNSVSMLQ